MTLEEKVSQMSHLAPAINRLGVVAYQPNFENPLSEEFFEAEDEGEFRRFIESRPWENWEEWEEGDCLDGGWWNEALHGVARAGLATSFPQSIAMGSTWNPELMQRAANAISDEARVHHNVYGKKLTFWSPTINILRDPRWGRNEESYSEDPYLLSRMAVAFVKGLQGDHPKYLKAVATPKHFVANNSEYNRHTGSSDVSERWLREYYLYAFEASIREGNAYSVMGAYNAVNGIPSCANSWLLDDVLRKEWGFQGYVVSDCGAVSDIVHGHEYETDPERAVALAVKAGTDLECETCEIEQFLYDKYLLNAVKKGYLSEADIDKAVTRLFRTRFLLGEFDPPRMVPFNKIPRSRLDCKEHRELAHQAAREAMVLLKNENRTLPLDKESIRSVAVIGPNADVVELGGYSGSPAVEVSPLQGIREMVGDHQVEVRYALGCEISDRMIIDWDEENDHPIWKDLEESETLAEAVTLAKETDFVILCLGTNLDIANEAADRSDLELPGNQLKLAQDIFSVNPNTIVVLINGMTLSIDWVDENIPAILEAWYPGQAGGTAIAEVLFGDYNPGGKLPVTFYESAAQLAPLADYDVTKGRTYWFYNGDPIYPFGHGLSYTHFTYSNLSLSTAEVNFSSNESVALEVEVANTGEYDGDEVVQLYIQDMESSLPQPGKKLRDFKRIHLEQGKKKTITFELGKDDFHYWNEEQQGWFIEDGAFELQVGSSSSDIRLREKIEITSSGI
jgi:beta-glucosidase